MPMHVVHMYLGRQAEIAALHTVTAAVLPVEFVFMWTYLKREHMTKLHRKTKIEITLSRLTL